jgi:ABC-type phosphonate transport system ATPase subunit
MIPEEGKIQYFLGTNSALGFVSLYHELIDECTASAVYYLKGGAGCGKSTLMKKVGEKLEAKGITVEYILCSGDPDSLDGIYIPEKAVAIMDGTAPHGKVSQPQKSDQVKTEF